MSKADLDLANRLEAFAAYCERYLSHELRQSKVEDIRLAARRLKELTPPDSDVPETSRSSHYSG